MKNLHTITGIAKNAGVDRWLVKQAAIRLKLVAVVKLHSNYHLYDNEQRALIEDDLKRITEKHRAAEKAARSAEEGSRRGMRRLMIFLLFS